MRLVHNWGLLATLPGCSFKCKSQRSDYLDLRPVCPQNPVVEFKKYIYIYLFCHRDHYGFVTFYDTKDAFTAIENGSKLRKPDELPFDLCFGGRRQFCQTSYADLGNKLNYYFNIV